MGTFIRISAIFLTFILTLAASNEECSEENVKQCFSALKKVVVIELMELKNTQNLDNYCRKVEEKNCLKDVTEACKEKYVSASSMAESFYAYLTMMCGSNREVFETVTQCLIKHEEDFKECRSDEENKNGNNLEMVCKELKGLKCIAKGSKKICDRGEEFATLIDKHIVKLQSELCHSDSGSTALYSMWNLLTVVGVLWLSRKVY